MLRKNVIRRKYDSSRRKARSLQNQLHITQVAERLFIERGYNGTSIELIAQTAGVAPETIYSQFGNKQSILSRVVGVAVVGDGEPIPLLARTYIQEVESEKDQHRQIRMFASRIQIIMSRVAPLFEVMRSAARNEPEIHALLRRYLNGRMEGMGYFVDCVSANGKLRLDKQAAIETLWTLTSAEVFMLLRKDRDWSAEEYEYWLTESLDRLLLP